MTSRGKHSAATGANSRMIDIGATGPVDGSQVFHVGRIEPPDADEFVELWDGKRRVVRHLRRGVTAAEVVEKIGAEDFVRLDGAHPSSADPYRPGGRTDWYRRSMVVSVHPFPPGEKGAPIQPGETGTIVKFFFSPPYKGFEARRAHMEGGAMVRRDVNEMREIFGL